MKSAINAARKRKSLILHREFAPFLEVLLYREGDNARALTCGLVAFGHTLG